MGSEVVIVNTGMMYAAPNERGGWSRVLVTDIHISGCSVFFIDHGNYGKALKMKNLVPYWLTRPEMAKLCFLQPVPPPEQRERIKEILKPGVEIEVDGLRLENMAQSVTVRIDGRTLEEVLQADEQEEPSDVETNSKDTELRVEAVDFVPIRNWDAIGSRLVSKFVKRCEEVVETKDICESLGLLLKKACEADILTDFGKDFLQV